MVLNDRIMQISDNIVEYEVEKLNTKTRGDRKRRSPPKPVLADYPLLRRWIIIVVDH